MNIAPNAMGAAAADIPRSGYQDLLDLPGDLLDMLPAAVYVCDADGLVVRCNRKAIELWGRTPRLRDREDRFCGSWRMYRLDGGPLRHEDCPMADVLRTGRAVRDQEVIIERPDGGRITALVSISPLRDTTGAVAGAVNCFQDITERKRAEVAVRERERQFRELLDALPAAIYTTDAAGRITYYNQAAVDLSGNRPKLGSDEWCVTWRLYWPDGRPMPHDRCPMAVALKENRPVRGVEAIAERPDGSRVSFIPYPMPLHDESGALVGAVNMLVDITERKRSEETGLLLAALVESSDDAIVSKDLNGVITSWNRGAERLFGYSAEEAIGKSIMMLIPPDRHAEEPRILASIRRGEGIEHFETVRRRKDGSEVEISLTVSPVRNAEGRIIGVSKIARDITERRQAEERARLLAREVDHRAKNMLATVQTIARMTHAETVPDFVDVLTGRLEALSRAHSLLAESRWTNADLKRLVEEELAAYRTGNGGRVTISGPNLGLHAEAAQVLAMALHELATNAAKYGALSAPDGRVAVEWSWDSGGRLGLRWAETGGPPICMPARRGFGSRMIEGAINAQLDGVVRLDWLAEGLVCRMTIPREKLLDGTGQP